MFRMLVDLVPINIGAAVIIPDSPALRLQPEPATALSRLVQSKGDP